MVGTVNHDWSADLQEAYEIALEQRTENNLQEARWSFRKFQEFLEDSIYFDKTYEAPERLDKALYDFYTGHPEPLKEVLDHYIRKAAIEAAKEELERGEDYL